MAAPFLASSLSPAMLPISAPLALSVLAQTDEAIPREPAAPDAGNLRAFIELVRHSSSSRLLAGLGLQPLRLKSLAQIAKHVPVRRITYPTGLEYLPKVCDTILEDLRALPHQRREENALKERDQ